MNLPEKNKLQSIIFELKNADLSRVNYLRIINILVNELRSVPYTTTKLKAGHFIERARINKSGEIFNSEAEITYRTDFENIKEFGRANAPQQSMFYGAIKSDHIRNPRIVNLFESSELYRQSDKDLNEFIMTVGKWKIKQDFEVALMTFNKKIIENIPSTRIAYEYHYNNLKKDFPDRIDDIELVLEFFSDEFAKKNIKTHNDYKISSAYSELAINVNGLNGVIYPSVRTDFQGTNVALTPQAVENYLELEVVAMFHIYKKRNKSFMDNAFIAKDFGYLNSSFKWEKIKEQDDEIINKVLLEDE